MTATASASTYTVEAYNVSHASENKIHDDTIAKKLGFTGGLVPGVEVYAYATHLAVAQWGRAWLERGALECRFQKPVYDGAQATASGMLADGDIDFKIESGGELCSTGRASVPREPSPPPAITDYAVSVPPALEARPAASPESLPKGKVLGIRPFTLSEEVWRAYLADVRERHPIYAAERLGHPGQLLRQCNSVLRENVALPPWIHTGSKVQNYSAAQVGDEITARARVVDNYERKGHRLVDLDVLLVANDARVLARVLHTAIYQLRHLS